MVVHRNKTLSQEHFAMGINIVLPFNSGKEINPAVKNPSLLIDYSCTHILVSTSLENMTPNNNMAKEIVKICYF